MHEPRAIDTDPRETDSQAARNRYPRQGFFRFTAAARFRQVFSVATLIAAGWTSSAVAQEPPMLGIAIQGRKYVGRILAQDSLALTMLRRDGSILTLDMNSIEQWVRLSNKFTSYSPEQLESRLLNEFPNGYAVAHSPHFVVVYPAGSATSWVQAFEKLYRHFVHYFNARGFAVQEPEFPMVAVVLGSRAEFEAIAVTEEIGGAPQWVGFYSAQSNRIITYDQSLSESSAGSSEQMLATIVHEATHQTAFNTGVNRRFVEYPRWCSEGLAMMFEARGVHDCIHYPNRSDRIANNYLQALRQLIDQQRHVDSLGGLVSSDAWFNSDPETAYILSWGWTFFLVETRPKQYWQYLQTVNANPEFSPIGAAQRMHDFSRNFGGDLADLESRMKVFFDRLEDE